MKLGKTINYVSGIAGKVSRSEVKSQGHSVAKCTFPAKG